jgi:hypothetical protein
MNTNKFKKILNHMPLTTKSYQTWKNKIWTPWCEILGFTFLIHMLTFGHLGAQCKNWAFDG